MEGGQMRIYRRLPKRGFHNPAHVEYQVINLSDLAGANLADRVDIDGLHELRLVRTKVNPVKILGTGTIDRPLHIVAHAFSKSAQEKIAAAGGTCEWVNPPVEPIEAHHHGKHKKSAVDASKDDAGDANTKDTTS
jgi:large subunit ribosomal protein L15